MSRQPERLVLLGSVVADVVLPVPALPERGGDVLAAGAAVQAGGGFNVLSAARRLGLPAALGGRVGSGPLGQAVATALAAEGVDRLLPDAAGDTGLVICLVEPDGERTFVTSPGVESELTAQDLAGLRLTAADAIYISGYDLCYPVTGPVLAAWGAEHPEPLLVVDPGPLVAQIPPAVRAAVLMRTDALTLNAREATLLLDCSGAGTDFPDLRRLLRPEAWLILRDGPRGCTLHPAHGSPVSVPTPSVLAVDTTGAGDAHTGAFLAELARGASMVRALTTANRAAALSVTRRGSATGPTRAELDEQGTRHP